MSSSSSPITWNLGAVVLWKGCCPLRTFCQRRLTWTHFTQSVQVYRRGSWACRGTLYLLHSRFVALDGRCGAPELSPLRGCRARACLLLASPSSEISASPSWGPPSWERGDNLFGAGGAVCAGIQRRAEGCDSRTGGWGTERKKMMLGWETEGRALGGEGGETVRARDC